MHQTGHVDEAYLLHVIATLPPGVSEIYGHPATRQAAVMAGFQDGYDHAGEVAGSHEPARARGAGIGRRRADDVPGSRPRAGLTVARRRPIAVDAAMRTREWALSALFVAMLALPVAEAVLRIERWPLTTVAMFSQRIPPSVPVRYVTLVGTTADGAEREMTAPDFGLTPNELGRRLPPDIRWLGKRCGELGQAYNAQPRPPAAAARGPARRRHRRGAAGRAAAGPPALERGLSPGREMRRALARWHRHWFEPAPLADLAMARIVVVLILVVLDHGGRASWVALAPPGVFEPIAFLETIGLAAQPSPALVARVASIESMLLVLAGLGIVARPALAGIFVLQLVQEAWVNSLGKVTHATVPLLYTIVFLALAPCDRVLSLRAWLRGRPAASLSPDARWPIELAVVVLVAYYWKAGVSKLLDSGLAWADGATLQFYLLTNRMAWGTWLAGFPAACAALSACSLAFELGSPLGDRAAAPLDRARRRRALSPGNVAVPRHHVLAAVATYLVCVPWTRLATGRGVPLDTPPRARQ